MEEIMFILLLVAPEHGTNSGPHKASSQVAVVMSPSLTLKLLTDLVDHYTLQVDEDTIFLAQSSSSVQHSEHSSVKPMSLSLHA
jgi:hypothetical protein